MLQNKDKSLSVYACSLVVLEKRDMKKSLCWKTLFVAILITKPQIKDIS